MRSERGVSKTAVQHRSAERWSFPSSIDENICRARASRAWLDGKLRFGASRALRAGGLPGLVLVDDLRRAFELQKTSAELRASECSNFRVRNERTAGAQSCAG